MEGSGAGPQLIHGDLHGVEGLEKEYVQARTPVHQATGDLEAADSGVYNQRVVPYGRNTRGMIVTIELGLGMRPIQELRDNRMDRVD